LAAFLWGCQEQASSPVGPEGQGIILLAETGEYFDGSVYELKETRLDWKSAKKAARRMVAPGCRSAHLATITSPAEQVVLTDLMAGLFPADPPGSKNAWIGGFQPRGELSTDQSWHWITGERWVYTNWANSEPNDDNGPGSEQHLEALPRVGDAPWNDAPGFEEKFFVVESEHCN
jgi:hypothetical protein